jgi:hypothetical protein
MPVVKGLTNDASMLCFAVVVSQSATQPLLRNIIFSIFAELK